MTINKTETPIFACHSLLYIAVSYYVRSLLIRCAVHISFLFFFFLMHILDWNGNGEREKKADCWHEHVVDIWKLEKISVLLLKRCSVQNHTNNLCVVFFSASRKGAPWIFWMGKKCRTQFLFHAERKIKWIPLKQNTKNGTKNTNSTHYCCIHIYITWNPSENQSKNIICNCHSSLLMYVCMRFRIWLFRVREILSLFLALSLCRSLQWHYMQSNTWLWFDVQSNCIPFQWERKFNSHLSLRYTRTIK